MCGICGIIQPDADHSLLINEMCDMLRHRGPDNSGTYINKDLYLGHRRLSIIDLNTGDQPIFNEDQSIVVIFNGEIYNYMNFKKDLINKGHVFKTNSDTEILVHAYEEYGLSFLKDLNGIFAFAIYDLKNQKLILVRDHFGIKPLHYWHTHNTFVFASEQKAILLHPDYKRKINYSALHNQINLRYNQGNETLFKDIYRIPPGHCLVYKNNSLQLKEYYKLTVEPNYSVSRNEILSTIPHMVKTAVERQLLSDVPIGVYLSGGMDSSTIVSMMHELNADPINTFTLGFNEETDEFEDAQRIADMFNTNHHTTSLSFDPLILFPNVIWHAEEPKINLLQGFKMSEFVSSKCKVVLGGLGGDELFIGYDIYKFINSVKYLLKYSSENFQRVFLEPISKLLFSIENQLKTLRIDEYRRGLQMLLSIGNLQKFYLIIRNCWDYDKPFFREIYHPEFRVNDLPNIKENFDTLFNQTKELSSIDSVAYVEMKSKMVNDYLLVDDRMSMANSVELRVPFLDKDLVEYMINIPGDMKINKQMTKHLFREAMQPFLPRDIIYKKKWGFTVNPYLQFKKDLKMFAEKILTKKHIEDQGIFNYNYIRQILDYPPSPKLRWHYNYLWIVLGITIWEKMFITSDMFKKRKFKIEDYFTGN